LFALRASLKGRLTVGYTAKASLTPACWDSSELASPRLDGPNGVGLCANLGARLNRGYSPMAIFT
jgi:hypothetical protein